MIGRGPVAVDLSTCGHRLDGFAQLSTEFPVSTDVVLAELFAKQVASAGSMVPDIWIGCSGQQTHFLRVDIVAQMFC